MRGLLIAAGALALVLGGCASEPSGASAGGAAEPAVSADAPHIAAALATPDRPAEDRARDAARRSAEFLAFAEVRPGDRIGDLIMGGGYFTRLFATAVGPQGRVYAFQPEEFVKFSADYGTNLSKVDAAYENVVGIRSPLAQVSFPEPLDLVWTSQNYHDFHLKAFAAETAATVNKAVFAALKPGGVYLVLDHAATPGSGLRDADSLHRIDPDTVKAEVTAAGFVYEGSLDVLRTDADPRTASVFDASIRGKTDQFALKFRKPG